MTSRTSTILISTPGDTLVYRSLDEVPAPLRRRLERSTRGPNHGTILIADPKGQEELFRALDDRETNLRGERAADLLCPSSEAKTCRSGIAGSRLARWKRLLEFLVPIAVGTSLWLLLETKF